MILSDPQAKVKDYRGIKEPDIRKYTGSNYGIAYFYYQNNSNSGKTLVETVTLTQRENLRITPPFSNNDQFEVTVLPQRDALVMYKCLNGGQYVFATKSSFKGTILPVDEMTKFARMPYAETTYLDDLEDAINKSADTEYYDEFIRDDRDNLEIFDYGKVAEDMKNTRFEDMRFKEEVVIKEKKPKVIETPEKQPVNLKSKDVINLLEGEHFVDPFAKKQPEPVQVFFQPTEGIFAQFQFSLINAIYLFFSDPLREKNLYSLEVLGNLPSKSSFGN